MDKKSLALSTGINQEDVVHRAWEILLRWHEKEELSKIRSKYQRYVYWYFRAKRKLENPVHHRTGKPLKESTLYQLRCEHRRTQMNCEAGKMLIKLFIFDGILGKPGKALTARLEKYFKQLEGETTDSRLPFKFLIKAFNELKQKNPGKNYKSPEDRVIEQCERVYDEVSYYRRELEWTRRYTERLLGLLSGGTQNHNIPPKRKKRPDHNFNIIDGGKEVEEQPPFAD